MSETDGVGKVVVASSRPAPAIARLQKKSELVARQLIERIIAEGVRPGERLEHEGELIDQLGVSRATLREAFRLLEVAGILEMRPGRDGGAIVQQPSGDDFGRMVTLFFQITRVTYRDLLRATTVIQPAIYAHAAAWPPRRTRRGCGGCGRSRTADRATTPTTWSRSSRCRGWWPRRPTTRSSP
ncbi:MAG: GntR family transcriptional regulator [Acidimicrobiales bacterium]